MYTTVIILDERNAQNLVLLLKHHSVTWITSASVQHPTLNCHHKRSRTEETLLSDCSSKQFQY